MTDKSPFCPVGTFEISPAVDYGNHDLRRTIVRSRCIFDGGRLASGKGNTYSINRRLRRCEHCLVPISFTGKIINLRSEDIKIISCKTLNGLRKLDGNGRAFSLANSLRRCDPATQQGPLGIFCPFGLERRDHFVAFDRAGRGKVIFLIGVDGKVEQTPRLASILSEDFRREEPVFSTKGPM